MTNFANIIKIATMFIKILFKDSKNNYKLCSKMQSATVFPDITKVAAFCSKKAYVSRTHGACQVIYMFSGSSLVKV